MPIRAGRIVWLLRESVTALIAAAVGISRVELYSAARRLDPKDPLGGRKISTVDWYTHALLFSCILRRSGEFLSFDCFVG